MKVGIVGGGGKMGRSYAMPISKQGYNVLVSGATKKNLEYYSGTPIKVCDNNRDLVSESDVIIYSVPIIMTPDIIRMSVRHSRKGSTVGGFTSVKSHEVQALRKYTPKDSEIITYHPMHGPTPDLTGHTFVIVPVLKKEENSRVNEIEELAKSLGLKVSYLSSAEKHDKIMADTQVLTHLFHLCMGHAWMSLGFDPKDNSTYQNEVDRLKALQTKRILSQNPEVYAGIATSNPFVKPQIAQYTRSVDKIMKMEIRGDKKGLLRLCEEERNFFGEKEVREGAELLTSLFDDEYVVEQQTNSQLSVLAAGDSWKELGIHPRNIVPFQTPPYKIRYLIVYKILDGDIEQYVKNAINNRKIKIQDYYYCKAVTTFSRLMESGDYNGFVGLFKEIANFFGEDELKRAKTETDRLIKRLIAKEQSKN